jgi:ferric-dicitrate binding protein FerR (iron transport regulator)
LKTLNENKHELIINYLSGNASVNEIQILKDWLKESDENKRFFDEISDVWTASTSCSENDFNVVKGYQRVKKQLNNPVRPSKQQNKSLHYYRIFSGAAAVLVIALLLGIILIATSKKVQTSITENTITEITAPLGSKTKVTLPDGTKVWLNAGSTIRYNSAFNSTNRKVNLEGEAFFDVMKKKNNPFLVVTPEITIKVLGTAFNVKAYPKEGSVETTLVRGSLIVEQTSSNGAKTQNILAPRQRATLVKQTGKILLSDTESQVLKKEKVQKIEQFKGKVLLTKEIDTDIFTAWKDNRLVFRNETFESLSVKLERWYGVKITFADSEIKNYHFNGTIENETINDVLDIVKLTLPVDYTVLHNNITITKHK